MPRKLLHGESVTRSDHAFLRLATPDDLHDAVYLALSGVHVAFEPVPGFLSGFGCPRRVKVGKGPKASTFTVSRTPASIAATVRNMVTHKTLRIFHQDNAIRIATDDSDLSRAMQGIAVCLNQRAARPLDRNDIAGIMAWIATLTDTRIDAQVPYGCPEWGAFLRGEPSPGLGWTPAPAVPNFTRTITCHVQPSPEDLSRILTYGRIGIINGAAMRAKAPWGQGMSADKRLMLASHALAPMLTWHPHDAGAQAPVLTRAVLLSAGSPDAAHKALYGAVWDRARLMSADGFALARKPVPKLLQSVWQHQRDAMHAFGLDVVGMPPCDPADLRRHALDAGRKAADDALFPRTRGVTTTKVTAGDPIAALVAHAQWGESLCTHNAAVDVGFRDDEAAKVVSHLSGHWSDFVAGEFVPASAGSPG